MDKQAAKAAILSGETALGIEFGSTRIKAVLVDKQHTRKSGMGSRPAMPILQKM